MDDDVNEIETPLKDGRRLVRVVTTTVTKEEIYDSPCEVPKREDRGERTQSDQEEMEEASGGCGCEAADEDDN